MTPDLQLLKRYLVFIEPADFSATLQMKFLVEFVDPGVPVIDEKEQAINMAAKKAELGSGQYNAWAMELSDTDKETVLVKREVKVGT